MLDREKSRLITQVTGDAPMGRLMREYWIPVARGEQLKAGAAPMRLTILGDKLVAFRSPSGEVGVMDEACPHRGASMALARNEPNGLRCIYHGWKIGADGLLRDAPTHPEHLPLERLKTRSHPVREQQGMVWTWLGKGAAPAFRELAFTGLPDDQVITATAVVKCNWLRPMETLWDVFHSQMLHHDTNRKIPFRGDNYFSNEGRKTDTGLMYDYPEMLVERTPYGFDLVNSDARKKTSGHFVLPFIQFHTIGPDPLEDKALKISVPIDDDTTLLWSVVFNRHGPLKETGFGLTNLGRCADRNDLFNNLKRGAARSADTRWNQDREAMERGDSFSGYEEAHPTLTLLAEDNYVLESQGEYDRSQEQLGPVDRALVEGRRVLLDALKAHEANGEAVGRGVDIPGVEARYILNEEEAAAG
ncbi:Rieske 2Fe-2S domain-containing protein [Variovorax sp. KK3]|uniref:Rieske 2Fe-2S domain-containing protein n=1 Tax=Variovorax sp. KK3 TaxID=1855728 RepID=UPI00097C598F|nr:Rieske 2Fe-2S domain-containing protein [Variovorax sp. KK3]